LFILRALGIAGGSLLGSRWAGEPTRLSTIYWAAFITQAGIALGLAREVAVQFPTLGDAFATLIISVVVINEIVGPLFLKWGLRRARETHEPDADRKPGRHVVILGVEGQSIALARALQSQGWSAVLADTDADQIARVASEDLEERYIESVDGETMRQLVNDRTEAVVAMLGDDDANARALAFASEMGVQGLVARPSSAATGPAFDEIEDVVTIDPGTAVVSLLEQAVTSPQSATLLLRRDPDRAVTQVKLVNPDLNGTPVRDLRLPTDVLLLQIIRGGSTVVVHGHTALQTGDDILVLASEDSLTEIRSRLSG
jgi:Trk K+ transport system NAD-binding subunit